MAEDRELYFRVSPRLDLTGNSEHNADEFAKSMGTLLHFLASEIGTRRIELNRNKLELCFEVVVFDLEEKPNEVYIRLVVDYPKDGQ